MYIEKCMESEVFSYCSMNFHNKYTCVTIPWVKKWDITGTSKAFSTLSVASTLLSPNNCEFVLPVLNIICI